MASRALPQKGKERRGGKRSTSFKPGHTNPGGFTREARKRREDIGAFIRGKLDLLGKDGRDNLSACVDDAIEAARNGSLPDREWLFAYAFGRPVQRVESKVDANLRVKIKRNVRAAAAVPVSPDADPDV